LTERSTPLDVKPIESCVAAWIVPVAETVERTTPRATVAVRVDVWVDAVLWPTTRYAAAPAPASARASAAFIVLM
jgi:hypothetical protein